MLHPLGKKCDNASGMEEDLPLFFDSNEPPDINQEPISTVLNECVSFAHFLQIEVNFEEMKELVNCAGEPLSNEEHIKMQSLEILEEYLEDDNEGIEEENKCFSTKGLAIWNWHY